MNCSARLNAVCIKVERTWRVITGNTSELKAAYSRLCYPVEECTLNECRENNWKCKVDCCNTNLCNASTIMSAHALLIGVLLCFALEAISAFQKNNILKWKNTNVNKLIALFLKKSRNRVLIRAQLVYWHLCLFHFNIFFLQSRQLFYIFVVVVFFFDFCPSKTEV